MPIAAKQGDLVVGTDTHIVVVAGQGPVPTPMPFNGTVSGGCSPDVFIDGAPAAIVGSTATNTVPHPPAGGPFQTPPTNRGDVTAGSATVYINNRPAARAGDQVTTCSDPLPAPNCTIQAAGTVEIGG